jgi:hypothetical protein
MKPPIIIDERGDTDIFETVEDAERYIEPIDAEHKVLVGYDSEGCLLRLDPAFPRVTIRAMESEPSHAAELREVLIKFLANIGIDKGELLKEPLSNLIARAVQYKTK